MALGFWLVLTVVDSVVFLILYSSLVNRSSSVASLLRLRPLLISLAGCTAGTCESTGTCTVTPIFGKSFSFGWFGDFFSSSVFMISLRIIIYAMNEDGDPEKDKKMNVARVLIRIFQTCVMDV